jgi:hypothetical protein
VLREDSCHVNPGWVKWLATACKIGIRSSAEVNYFFFATFFTPKLLLTLFHVQRAQLSDLGVKLNCHGGLILAYKPNGIKFNSMPPMRLQGVVLPHKEMLQA